MRESLIDIAYLVSAVLFIFGLKLLSSPKTAVRGNLISAFGMLLAVVATLFVKDIVHFRNIAIGLIIGAVAGGAWAYLVKMTQMPQTVAIFNGFGGIASALVAISTLYGAFKIPEGVPLEWNRAAVGLSIIVGSVTFFGSFIAFAKLQEIIKGDPISLPLHKLWNLVLLISALVLTGFLVSSGNVNFAWIIFGVSAVLGVMLVIPIGGADMPVAISLLNAYSGLAAAISGFVLNNYGLIITGSLVGSSGFILTKIMADAMNRKFVDILIGNVTIQMTEEAFAGVQIKGRVKKTDPQEVAILLDSANTIAFVPGYGMAVSQAQFAVKELFNLLTKDGKEVYFAIHPVAGRMPGHMNVLLAEADIPYDKIKTLEESNSLISETDIAFVIGANDVVNPLARDSKDTPISGMPIIEVDRAKTVIVLKRSMRAGFSGVPNPLFYLDNSYMLFGDAKQSIQEVAKEFKEYRKL
ncbi:MAG: NAD(P)(+) transhydrogenase (Re/Si-specific) subunit beta [Candidatus Calescibacterium sp.]|nr:NAD(P)(+) transhydrogenase (Re/Si-specific) subunit beta [Candidatus Calescibacterium sp.]MCX7734268.1 NAD(P)(+) transhydrogenase (Re/Si-specific) subunit beta [bacterium]MDW8087099.1 NAD(P)(+) transhydrogenase (Re/Si-specific) subunit beta [Candidatus Calescibacterium sp.]